MEEEKDLEYSAIDHGDMKNLVYDTSSKTNEEEEEGDYNNQDEEGSESKSLESIPSNDIQLNVDKLNIIASDNTLTKTIQFKARKHGSKK